MSSGLDSPLSSLLSSPPASDDEISPPSPVAAPVTKGKGKGKAVSRAKPTPKKVVKGKQQQKLPFVRKASTPPRKVKKKEPPHVPTLADSPELAFIVTFRSRFADAFRGVPNLGCQDIERGIVDSTPSEQVEQFLCKLLSLVLNRKKPVERGHNQRALEEAANAHRNQWPSSWEGKSPFSGNKSFSDLDTAQRLEVLEALIHWSLSSSEVIRGIINDSYKGSRREDDLNVPLSVQPWGRDAEKRRYWLIEGRDDTPFRLYRESNPALKTHTWISIAGTIEEIQTVAKELEEEDGSKHALALKEKIVGAIPRFEEGEIRRKKREYRASRKAFFNQPSGVSLYEGRTRGKRIRYNFSTDDEGAKETSEQDDNRSRRSARSNKGSPAPQPQPQPEAPRFTASGRQIRKPVTGDYGEVKINGSNGTATASRGTPFGSDNGDHNNRDSRGFPLVGVVVYKSDDKEDEGDDEQEESEDEAGWGSGPDEAEDKDTPRKSLKIVFKIPKTPGSADSSSPASGNKNVVSPSKAHQIIRVAGGEPTPTHSPIPNGNGIKSNGIHKKDIEDVTMSDIEPIKELNPAVNGARPPVDQKMGLSA